MLYIRDPGHKVPWIWTESGRGGWSCENRIVCVLGSFKRSFHLVKYLSSAICCPVVIKQGFGGTYCLGVPFLPWRWRQCFPTKRWQSFTRLRDVSFQNAFYMFSWVGTKDRAVSVRLLCCLYRSYKSWTSLRNSSLVDQLTGETL